MTRARRSFLLLPLLAAFACGGDFDPASRVSKLRVLAVKSDLPFAKRGETVTLDVLAHDPAGRATTFGFALCKNPQSSSVLECLRGGDPTPLAQGDSPRVSFAVPDVRSLGVIVAACPGQLHHVPGAELPYICEENGRALPLESFELGIKRVFVRERDRNENPRIDRVTWDGVDWPEAETRDASACDKDTNEFDDCPAALAHRVSAVASAPEAGTDESGASFRERVVVQYYASEGIFEHDARIGDVAETRWVGRKSSKGEIRFWIVVRDDRGGVSWAERRVNIR